MAAPLSARAVIGAAAAHKHFAFREAGGKTLFEMQRRRMTGPAVAAACLLLAACGAREPLRPKPGDPPPPAPAMATRASTTEEMLTPPPIARPERAGEPLRRSEEREDDRFDLPPP